MDTILFNGNIINGTPTLQIANTASLSGIPYYLICENAKSDIYNLRQQSMKAELGFDKISAGSWAAIVTESGVIRKENFRQHMGNLKDLF